jgi:hypothetical protein
MNEVALRRSRTARRSLRVDPGGGLRRSRHSRHRRAVPLRLRASRARAAILSTWDAFVDELWGGTPAVGATLVAATFPRAYVDANRAADDIDPDLLAEPWPEPLSPTT